MGYPLRAARSPFLHLLGAALLATLHVAVDDDAVLASVMPVAVVRTVRQTRRKVAGAAVAWLAPLAAGGTADADEAGCSR
ncbi:MAG: hypothetical protein AAGG50_03800 [Bacteroidota bacterium]